MSISFEAGAGALSFAAVLFLSSPIEGAVVYVNGAAPNGGDGQSWATAFNDLQNGLAASSAGTQIWVAAGTYEPTVPVGDRTISFNLVSGAQLYGGFDGTEANLEERDPVANVAILSGDLNGNDVGTPTDPSHAENSHHVTRALNTAAETVLDGFTIVGGKADGAAAVHASGGGLHCDNAVVQVANCMFTSHLAKHYGSSIYCGNQTDATVVDSGFTGNVAIGVGLQAGAGAGLFGHQSQVVITGCFFTQNSGVQGSALAFADGVTASINQCRIADNTASYGAAALLTWAPTTVTDSTFEGNNGANLAGAVAIGSVGDTGPRLFNRCRFLKNSTAGGGGGLYNEWPNTMVVNCAFTGNVASNGGAVYGSGGSFQLINCSMTLNSAAKTGGGASQFGGSPPQVRNCIFWDNTGGNGQAAQLPLSAIVSYSCIQDAASLANGNIDDDPLFTDADGLDDIPGTHDDDLSLQPGSPCIDAADNSSIPAGNTTDLDGQPRFVDDPRTIDTGLGTPPIIDMGALEFQGLPIQCPSDINGDGEVAVDDVLAIISAWGECAQPCPPSKSCPADLDADCVVNVNDLLAVIADWGPCP